MIVQIVASFVAVVSFCILFNAPKSELVYCGIVGIFGWLTYFFSLKYFEQFSSTFLSTIVITIISRFSSTKRKMPFTIYFVAGIMPLVPGAGIYNTMCQ